MVITWDACTRDAKNDHSFSVLCGNWGGDKYATGQQTHMMNDMKESPATVLCIQEKTADSCKKLEQMGQEPPSGPSVVRRQQDNHNKTARNIAKDGEATHFWVVRAAEEGKSLAVAVRSSIFQGLRREEYIQQYCGSYNNKGK